jgi:hypothetical protein
MKQQKVMENKNIISDEMLASVVDGVATREIRRLVFDAIEGDEELRQVFNHCMYMKVFDEEIENDFRADNADLIVELEPVVEHEAAIDHTTIFNITPLSASYIDNEEKNEIE